MTIVRTIPVMPWANSLSMLVFAPGARRGLHAHAPRRFPLKLTHEPFLPRHVTSIYRLSRHRLEHPMKLKNLGVWAGTDGFSAADSAAFARRLEAWSYGALWVSEAVGREVLSSCAWLLANTSDLIVASGIANIYARDSFSAAAAQKGLNEQSSGSFLLGPGVSHIPPVED